MNEDCLVIDTLSIAIVDSSTGEVLGSRIYTTGTPGISDKDELLSDKRLVTWLSSFKRGCFKCDNLTIQIDYSSEKIF